MSKPLFSIVSPVYRAEQIVPELVRRIRAAVETITQDYEIILVEDGSPDKSWEAIAAESKKEARVKGIQLSRNFGQHYAITAGLDHTNGEWVVVMDCDLQDQPEEIASLYQKAKEGYDIVMAQREMRTDGFSKKLFSKLFYLVFNYLTDIKHDSSIANYGIYSRKAVNAFNQIREPNRSFSLIARWLGFNKTYVPVTHGLRDSGVTSYNWKKLIGLAINVIVAYSNKPLSLTIRVGFLISLISFLVGFYYLFLYFFKNIPVQGYTSIIISIWFLGGLIIFFLGVIGLYISKIFESVKSRPLYIIDKKLNL